MAGLVSQVPEAFLLELMEDSRAPYAHCPAPGLSRGGAACFGQYQATCVVRLRQCVRLVGRKATVGGLGCCTHLNCLHNHKGSL
jgi:hypothetical protein